MLRKKRNHKRDWLYVCIRKRSVRCIRLYRSYRYKSRYLNILPLNIFKYDVLWIPFIFIIGEAIIITKTEITKSRLIEAKNFAPCIFEYVYFARPDSVIDGISVYSSRLVMGEYLADQVLKKCGNSMDIDVVIPVSTYLKE